MNKISAVDNIDFSQLYDLTGGRKPFLIKLLNKITDSLNEYPNEIKSSFLASDYHRVRELAHKFKSSVVYLKHNKMNLTLNNIELSEDNQIPIEEVSKYVDDVLEYSKEILPPVKQKIEELQN